MFKRAVQQVVTVIPTTGTSNSVILSQYQKISSLYTYIGSLVDRLSCQSALPNTGIPCLV